MKKIVSFLMIVGVLTAVAAEDKQEMKTHAELSYANTIGNTESQDVAGNLKMNIPFYSNEVRFVGNILYSENTAYDENGTFVDDLRTKNRWDAELNYDYNFNESIAFNYIAGAKGDEFSTFVYQIYTGPGAIYTPLKTETQELKLQGNVLYMWDEIREDITVTPIVPEYMHRYSGYQVSLDYVYNFTETSKFAQYLMYRSQFADATNYFVKSKTALESKMSDTFSLGVSYTVDYTNNKADDVRAYTDGVFLASLIADF